MRSYRVPFFGTLDSQQQTLEIKLQRQKTFEECLITSAAFSRRNKLIAENNKNQCSKFATRAAWYLRTYFVKQLASIFEHKPDTRSPVF